MTPNRPRPAPADHRRPEEPARPPVCVDTIINQKGNWGERRPEEAGSAWHLCGHRARRVPRSAGVRQALEDGRLRSSTRPIVAARPPTRPAFKWPRPLHRLGHRPSTGMLPGQARPDRVRRPVQGRPRRNRAISLAAAPPRRAARPTRATSLLHFAAAGALREALRRAGRGLETGLPIVETKANDVSAYIPTKRHLHHRRPVPFLESDLFNQGVRAGPFNVGNLGLPGWVAPRRSKAMSRWPAHCGWTCPSTASWRPSPAFGSDLDAASAASPGARQPLGRPCSSRASTRHSRSRRRSVLDLPGHPGATWTRCRSRDIGRFETDFLDHVRRNEEGIFAEIRDFRAAGQPTTPSAWSTR